jgi:hypothetical protein
MIDWLRRAEIDPEIELNGERVPIVLRPHARARRLTLRLAPDGSEVRITLPRWAHHKEALAFAHARSDWLARQHAAIPRRHPPGPGGKVLLRGVALRIDWSQDAPREPRAEAGRVCVGGPAGAIEGRLRRWLEAQALDLVTADTAHYCTLAGLDPVPVTLSRAQRRWGSCSDKSRIRINWRLVQAPDFVRRSVVAHEVAHLIHFDHSPAFHALLGSIYEDRIERADRWLRERGRSLYAAFG